MRVLVTGATGFLGSSVTRRLLAEGHAVGVLARGESRLDKLQDLLPRIAVHRHDGSYASLLAAIRATKPQAVVHLASLFLMQHQEQDVARLVESNLGFPLQLLDAMCQEGVAQLINTGASWQHFGDDSSSPVNLYAASKQAFEALLAYYVEAKGLKAITLKLFDTYGPGDTRPKLFSLLRRSTKSGELLRMSPGEQRLDLVFVDDVAEAYALALQRVPLVNRHECHAVSNPPRLSLRQVAAIYADVVGRAANIEWGGLPYRPREVMQPWSDYSLLPGWRPCVTLDEGIARMERDASIGGLLAGQNGRWRTRQAIGGGRPSGQENDQRGESMEPQVNPQSGLDRVTLCCVTSRDLALSEKALLRCMRHLRFGRVVLFSPGLPSSPKIDHVAIPPFTSNKDYDRFVLFDLVKHVATDFVLIIHFDGFVLNPDAWNEGFLDYDYIGARWPWHADKQVGNGGFCLRSGKLLRALANPRFERPEIPEDELICRIERDYLERECGIRFAPPDVADAFSLEHADIPRASFGFHGLFHLHLAYRDAELDEAMKLMNPAVYAGGNALLWFQALVRSGGHRILPQLAQKILATQTAEILSRNCAIYGFPPLEVALALARAVSR